MAERIYLTIAEAIEMHESTLVDYAYPHGRIWSGDEALAVD